MFYSMTRGVEETLLLAATSGAVDVSDVVEQIQSDATAEEKTSFLIQYLMAQREPLMNLGKTLIVALLVFLIGRKVIRWLLRLLNRWMGKTNIELSVHKFVLSLCNVLLYLLLIFCVAGVLGVGTSSIVAILGSAGLAVGLALQGSLSNFAGGILILLLKPFRVGDYIIATGVEGTVCNIDIFYTRIVTSDNKVIVIPNGTLSNSNITNTSQEEKRLLVVDFMVSCDTDIEEVRRILLALMSEEKLICQDKPTAVQVDRLYPGRVKLVVKAWVATGDYWEERYRLLEQIQSSLKNNRLV